MLWFHSLPYIGAICVLARFVMFDLLDLHRNPIAPGHANELLFHFYAIVGGIVMGMVLGMAIGIAFGIAKGIAFGIAFGTALGSVAYSANGIVNSIAIGIAFGIAAGIALGSVARSADAIAVGIAIGIVLGFITVFVLGIEEGIVFGTVVGIAATFSILRLYYYPIHLVFVWPETRHLWYPSHPVAWDDLCFASFAGLHKLLVSLAETQKDRGEAEIENLIANYPTQRLEALRAKTILLARKASRLVNLTELDNIVAQLPEGVKGFLSETARVREWVNEISRLQTKLNIIDRPFLREPDAKLLCKEIETFQHRIRGLYEPLGSEFYKAATRWQEIAQKQLKEAQAIMSKETTPQVFRAGDPVDREQEAFVARYAVIGELERQIMLSTGCPGIVFYGRRRMGKSTILRNLTGFLPSNMAMVSVSMQNPQLFTSLESLVRSFIGEIQKQIPRMGIAAESMSDLRGFYGFLSESNKHLEADNKHLLLAVDEYEAIDQKIGEGLFTTDLLDTIRESIQTHRRITWIFVGNHEITELPHASWTSYLVSARTIEVNPFTFDETRMLLTEPLKHSSRWNADDPKRPHFDASFWGEGSNCGIQRIHHEAGGWPHLVQLIAETIVGLINDDKANKVNSELMEKALDKSIISGQNVLFELMRRESLLPGEWEYLSAFRQSETQPPPNDNQIASSLRRRLLISEQNTQWQLRVPLMARWLKQKG